MNDFILSTDAARGMMKKHSHVMRDLTRVRSMLSPEEQNRWLILTTIENGKHKGKRAYKIPREALLFLLAGKETRSAINWLKSVL